MRHLCFDIKVIYHEGIEKCFYGSVSNGGSCKVVIMGDDSELSLDSLENLEDKLDLEEPLRLQITGKYSKTDGSRGRVVLLELSDSVRTTVFKLSQTTIFSPSDRRSLKPFNIIDVTEIEQDIQSNGWILKSFNNARVYGKRIGDPIPSDVLNDSIASSSCAPSSSLKQHQEFDSPAASTFVPISDLTNQCSYVSIRGKAEYVSKTIRPINGRYGPSHVFDFVLVDDTGRIKVTVFGDLTDEYFKRVQEGGGYALSNFDVKPVGQSNKGYNTAGHAYGITVSAGTQLQQDVSAGTMRIVKTEYMDISELLLLENQTLTNIQGIVVSIEDAKTLHISGRPTRIRKLSVVDRSMHLVEVTLWGDLVECNATPNKSITLHHFRAQRFQGFGLSSFLQSRIVCENNPKLESWWDKEGRTFRVTKLKSVFDKRNCETATICIEMCCAKLEKEDSKAEELNGVYRLMQVTKMSTFYQCSHCKGTMQPPTNTSVKGICNSCGKVSTLSQPQYAATFVFGDMSGEFDVSVFTNVFTNFYERTGNRMPLSVRTLTMELERVRYQHFHVFIKLDFTSDGHPRIQLTEFQPWSLHMLPLYYSTIVKREIIDTKLRGQVFNEYWKKTAEFAVCPIRLSSIATSERQVFLESSPYDLFTFAATLDAMDYIGGKTHYVFKVGELSIVLEDILKKIELDEDTHLDKLCDVVVQKKMMANNQFAVWMVAVELLPDDFADQYEINRKLITDYMATLRGVYRHYGTCDLRDQEEVDDVDQSLSPEFSVLNMRGGPPSKRSRMSIPFGKK